MRKAERTVETHLELHEVRTVETDGEINPYGNIGGSLLKNPEDDWGGARRLRNKRSH